MPSYEPPSHKRWNPKGAWLQVSFHPAPRGRAHSLKLSEDAEPFEAYLSYDGIWRIKDRYGIEVQTTPSMYWFAKV